MNWSPVTKAEVPPGLVTTMSTGPAARDGAVAVIWVAELTAKAVAGLPAPKVTLVTPARSVPVMTTLPPPMIGPAAGATPPRAGAFS